MTEEDLKMVKDWAISRTSRTIFEISKLKEKISKLIEEYKKEKSRDRKKVLKDVIFELLKNESEFKEKLAFYQVVAKKANDYLNLIFPELPSLG